MENKPEHSRFWQILSKVGPGLITGAADDDPSGIATYSQVGAQFGYGMLWTMLFSFPLMAAVQEISARIGRVSGIGIAGNVRRCYPKPCLYSIVILLLVANIFNIGADVGAMGAAATLMFSGPIAVFILLAGVASLLLQILVPYRQYVKYLKWLTIALFSYVITAIILREPTWPAIRATFLPSFSRKNGYFMALIAILGTTISPYLFFWQASEEVEDVNLNPREQPLKRAPQQAPAQLRRIRIDTLLGMGFSNLVAFFIILTAASTLYAHGLRDIQTADQAARALEPFAGRFALSVFATGIIGTGLLAVPVLAGSAAYAISEVFKWRASLEAKPVRATEFYTAIAVSVGMGLLLNFLHFNPIRALFISAVLNGVVAGPVLIFMMLLARNPRVMGEFILPASLRFVGWLAAGVMVFVSLGMLASIH